MIILKVIKNQEIFALKDTFSEKPQREGVKLTLTPPAVLRLNVLHFNFVSVLFVYKFCSTIARLVTHFSHLNRNYIQNQKHLFKFYSFSFFLFLQNKHFLNNSLYKFESTLSYCFVQKLITHVDAQRKCWLRYTAEAVIRRCSVKTCS